MVRKYTPKRRPWADKDKRMVRAAELRSAGLSQRQIAARLVVSVGTVNADLKRYDREHTNVAPLRSVPAFKSAPTGAELNTRTERPAATVTPLRRTS